MQSAIDRWRAANPEKVRSASRSSARRWKKENRSKANANDAAREAAKIRATPPWANMDAIRAIYAEARRLTEETGIPHHVDHIVPLRSKIVCGLHCEANLQILVGADNIRKGNRHWPDMPT